jgi:hypothetical protein
MISSILFILIVLHLNNISSKVRGMVELLPPETAQLIKDKAWQGTKRDILMYAIILAIAFAIDYLFYS